MLPRISSSAILLSDPFVVAFILGGSVASECGQGFAINLYTYVEQQGDENNVDIYLRCQLVCASLIKSASQLITKPKPQLRGTGDSGRSSLYTNEKRWKNDAVFEALGTTDELSSQLGVAREKLSQLGLVDLCELLVKVQSVLQDVGSHLATPPATGSKAKVERTAFNAALVQEIDEQIDFYGDKSPPLRQFILPGGLGGSAELHVCRSVCRRLERRIAAIVRGCGTAEDDPTSSSNQSGLDLNVLKYVNRLSDLLFVMARYANTLSGQEEISYRKPFARKNL